MTETKKKRGNPAWEKGKGSPNPGGRPTNTVSLTAIAKRFIGMTPQSIAAEVGKTANKLKTMGDESNMGEIIVASFLYSLALDPQPGNMAQLWRRIDGEVAAPTFDIDLDKLSTQQLEMLRDGADLLTVLAAKGTSGPASETTGDPTGSDHPV